MVTMMQKNELPVLIQRWRSFSSLQTQSKH